MKVTKLLILFLIIISQNCFSQQTKIDSLKTVLKTSIEKNEKLEIYLNLIINHNDQIPEATYLNYLKNSLSLAKELNNYRYESIVYGYFAARHRYKRSKDSALFYVKKAKENSLLKKDYLQYLDDVNLEGIIYSEFNELDKSIQTCLKALELIEKEKIDNENVGRIYVRIGSNYFSSNQYNKALSYYIKAIDEAEKYGKVSVKLEALRGIILINYDNSNYKKAKKYGFEGLDVAIKNNNRYEEASIQRILAVVYLKEKKLDSALYLQKKAIQYFENIDNAYMVFDLNIKISHNLNQQKRFKEGNSYAKKALEIASYANDTILMISSKIAIAESNLGLKQFDYSINLLEQSSALSKKIKDLPFHIKTNLRDKLYNAYFKKGDYKKAVVILNKIKKSNDSLFEERLKNNILSIETKYQTEKKELENLTLRNQKSEQEKLIAQQNKRNWQLGIGLALAITGMGIFFYYFRRNKKQKQKIEALQKELHHRLKNNLAFIDVFIGLAKDKFKDADYQEKLTELQNRIKSMFEVHQQLFEKENITTVNASKYITKLTDNIKNAYINDNITISKNIDASKELDSQTSFPLGIIINEFITNSYKYAFNPDEKGLIKIALKDIGRDYSLTLSDNGKGLPSDFDVQSITSFGLDSIKLLTQEYHGTFALNGQNGVTLQITLPKKVA